MKTLMRLLLAVKAHIQPIDFYRIELPGMAPPKRNGWHDGGLFFFHQNRHAGSFYVNLQTGAFCCFSCGAKGSHIIAFIQRRYSLTFPEAVHKLAHEWGV